MTGQPFLQNAGSIYRIAMEIAWGADLTDLTGAGWTWVDVTTDVQVDQGAGISITVGRADESSTTQTSNMTCILDNRTGAYSQGGQSSNYPNVQRNTPIRVRISTDSGSTWTVKYQGNIVGFSPNWDTTGKWATVTLTAAGPLRRLDQGTLSSSSTMYRYMTSGADATVTDYWPMEDSKNSVTLRQVVGTSGPINYAQLLSGSSVSPIPASTMPLASNSGFACSAPLPLLPPQGAASHVEFYSLPYPASGTHQISGLYDPNGVTGQALIVGLLNNVGNFAPGFINVQPTGTYTAYIMLFYTLDASGGTLTTSVYDGGASHTRVAQVDSTLTNLARTPFRWRLAWSGTTYTVGVLRVGDATETVTTTTGTATRTVANFNYSVLGPYWNGGGDTGGGGIGHVAYHNAVASLTPSAAFLSGHDSENVSTRVARLGTENGIPITVLDSATATNASLADVMGPQYYDNPSNLLRECEATNQGALYDGLSIGLTYATRKFKESQQPVFTADASAGQVVMPFAPVDDDRLNINQVSATQRAGSTATYEDDSGPLGVNAIGIYGTSITVNPDDATNLQRYAQWLVGLGTQPGYRYPTWTLYLHKPSTKALIPAWLTMTPSSRFDVSNVHAVRAQHLDDTIRNLLEGWTETIDQFQWIVTANCTNYDPWKVITVAAATGSTADTVCHADTDSSQLNASATAGATSLSVKTNSGPVWITAAGTGGSDNFPFDIDVGGVKVHVTNITSTTSPQTFTVSAIPQNFASATPVKVWRPPVLGL